MQRKRRDLSGVCEPGRSQSPHCTAAVPSKRIVTSPGSKTGPREGGQEGGHVKATTEVQKAPGVPATATHGADARRTIAGVEASVWTERMLSALGNGVKGGKWYSLMDKVYAPKTLAVAWAKVRANNGAAGVDGQSIGRFAAKADVYLSELSAALRASTYRPQPVKRVDIPKGDGRTRPLGIPTRLSYCTSRSRVW